jgi:hypothetical protein
MPIPDTSDGLRAAGYQYKDKAHCRGCGAEIEWWITPNGHNMPISLVAALVDADGCFTEEMGPGVREVERRVAHFANCPRAGDFRRK